MSVTQSSSRDDRSNLRCTRSSDVGLRLMRFTLRGPGMPAISASCIRIVTSTRLTWTAALGEFGVHATRPVGAAADGVDLTDEAGEPLSTDLRGRHRTGLGQVAAGARHAEHLAALLHSEPGADEGVDHRVDPFGRTTSLPSSS